MISIKLGDTVTPKKPRGNLQGQFIVFPDMFGVKEIGKEFITIYNGKSAITCRAKDVKFISHTPKERLDELADEFYKKYKKYLKNKI